MKRLPKFLLLLAATALVTAAAADASYAAQKGKPRHNDRHNIPKADEQEKEATADGSLVAVRKQSAKFVNGVKNRIGDLFKTQTGLMTHVAALQQSFNSLSTNARAGKIEAPEMTAKELFDAVKTAATHSTFDFPEFRLEVPALNHSMTFARVNGKVITHTFKN